MCVLMPPTENLGPRITDPSTIAAVLATKGKPTAVTELARQIGQAMGMPDADHFHVPVRPGTSCAALMEDGQMVCFLAAWVTEPSCHCGEKNHPDYIRTTSGSRGAAEHARASWTPNNQARPQGA